MAYGGTKHMKCPDEEMYFVLVLFASSKWMKLFCESEKGSTFPKVCTHSHKFQISPTSSSQKTYIWTWLIYKSAQKLVCLQKKD